MHEALLNTLAIGAFAVATWTDIRTRTIPNAIPATIAGLFVLRATVSDFDASTWTTHITMGIAILTGGAVLHALSVWGAGDAKLLAAASLWAGTQNAVALGVGFATGTFILCAACTLPFAWSRRMRKNTPLGCAIAAGAVAAIVEGWEV